MKKSQPDDAYTQIADEYSARIDTKPHNAYYDRPAVQALVPDVTGRTVLDAGCGPGAYSEWLIQQGAMVTGLDANTSMLAHARHRLGPEVNLIQANLEEPLEMLDSNGFEGILSALTISYVEDLHRLFMEFHRVLKRGGWLVFSTEHPFFSHGYFGIDDYFLSRPVEAVWSGFAEPVTVPSHYRSLQTITDALSDNGFIIERISEPQPTDDFKPADPERYQRLMTFPLFIAMRARKT